MVSFNPETQKASEMPEVWKRMLCDFEQKDLIKRKMM